VIRLSLGTLASRDTIKVPENIQFGAEFEIVISKTVNVIDHAETGVGM